MSDEWKRCIVYIVYGMSMVRKRLQERYKENVSFLSGTGRNQQLVCFNSFSEDIIRHMKRDMGEDIESAENAVLKAAAKIIQGKIRTMRFPDDGKFYPNPRVIGSLEEESKWMPKSLLFFFKSVDAK